ncbi:siderophore-interacting protein [Pseudoxanthobacter sp.]|uniref:siderophore-interacting protein n=1 Tax=Pseudoxanthobacter sp. TaxID=1925742 RepID=UPI002FDFFB44
MSVPSPADAGAALRHATTRTRFALRFRHIEVVRVDRLSPHLIRVAFAGGDLGDFQSAGFDDHVKLFFPAPGESRPVLPAIGPDGGPATGTGALIARDYTPRRFSAARGELEIEFAVHEAGPATAWALQAAPGQIIGLGGPRGSMVPADDFDWYLLAGDDAALPAIARRLESLPAGARTFVFAETGGPEDELPLAAPQGTTIRWLHRGSTEPGLSTVLDAALAAFVPPPGDGHVWIAAESGVARRLRTLMLTHHNHPKAWLKAAAYWRRGAAGVHDKIED